MKFSTPLTLAAITLMSTTGSTNARIGDGQRFLNDGAVCEDPSTHNPAATPQCIDVGTDYTCQNVRLGGAPEYRCVAPVVSCQDPDNYNPTFTPQCITVGSGGYSCKNINLGGDEPEYQCVPPSGRSAGLQISHDNVTP